MTAARARSLLDRTSAGAVASFVCSQMNPDGGFRGRSTQSDLYYTLFGIDCLVALAQEVPETALGPFLSRLEARGDLDLVHLSCLVRCLCRCPGELDEDQVGQLVSHFDRFRAPCGGYRLVLDEKHGSIYAGFLAMLAFEALGLGVPDGDGIVGSIHNLRADDGGFADRPGGAEGTTTVTAAAVLLLEALAGSTDAEAVAWLCDRLSPFGGFVAGPRVPVPDLLSTATTLHALDTVGIPLTEQRHGALAFIEGLWHDSGGFSAHSLDQIADCEFTYYALLSLGALAEAV
jgi:hypothetical protein